MALNKTGGNGERLQAQLFTASIAHCLFDNSAVSDFGPRIGSAGRTVLRAAHDACLVDRATAHARPGGRRTPRQDRPRGERVEHKTGMQPILGSSFRCASRQVRPQRLDRWLRDSPRRSAVTAPRPVRRGVNAHGVWTFGDHNSTMICKA